MKIVKAIDSLLNFIVFTFFLVSLSFAGYALFDVYSVYENTELEEDILKYKPTIQGENSFGTKFSLEDIQKINSDIVGWIRIDDTNIDYPILASRDNTQYLKKDYKGDYSPSGSIFLDYRNDIHLTDDYFVIYGHNMAKGLMFSDIKKFQKKDFFQEHSTGKLYALDGVYELEIISFNIIDANKSIGYKLQKYRSNSNQELYQLFFSSAIQRREVELSEDSRLILLSTCYGVGTYDRSVLLAKVVKSDDSNLIMDDSDEIRAKEIQEFDRKVMEDNKKKKFVDYIYVLISYLFVVGILFVRFSIHYNSRRKKRRKKKS